MFLSRRSISVWLGNGCLRAFESLHAAKLRGGQRVHLGDIDQSLDANFFAFRIAWPARRAVIHGFHSVTAENAGVRAPCDDFAFRPLAHHAFVIRINRTNHGMAFADAGARNGHVGFEFQAPVRMFLFETEEYLSNVAARFAHGNRWRYAHVEKQIGLFRCAAGSPGMAAADSAQIDDSLLASVGRFLLPRGGPLHDRLHQLMHPADGVHLFAAFAERGMHINTGARNAHPHRTKMLQHHAHVRRLTENADVGEHAVVYQVVRAAAVPAIFSALVLAPLRLFDFPGDARNDHVAFEFHAGALQRFDRLRVTNERTLHVVNTEAEDHSVFDHGMRLVTDSGEKFFAAGVGRVHVAVEHQVLAFSGAGPPANDVGAPMLHFLPSHCQAQLLKRAAHVFRHLQLFAGGTRNVDEVAGHRDNLFFADSRENSFG